MTSHRRARVVRPGRELLSTAVMEVLEQRQMLTALAGGDVFAFQQAPGTIVHINVNGDTQAEFVGAVVDDQNNVVLTDLPGQFLNGNSSGRGGAIHLGGVGGRKGVVAIGRTPIVNNGGIGSFPVDDKTGDINLNALASDKSGNTYSINVGTVHPPVVDQDVTVVQLVSMNNGSGGGTVVTNLQQGQLGADVMSTLSTQVGNVGDIAIDKNGLLYVIADTGNVSVLYTFDRATGTVQAQAQLARIDAKGNVLNRLSGVKAMGFDGNGELYIITSDYDGNPAVDSDGIPVGGTTPAPSNLDEAIVRIDSDPTSKTFGEFINGTQQSILFPATNTTTDQTYTSMIWNNGNFLATVLQEPQQAGGGGAAQTPPMELHNVPVNGRATIIGVLSNAGAGGGGGQSGGPQIQGMAYAQDINGNTILVGLDTNAPLNGGGGTQVGAQLVTIDPNTAAISSLGLPGTFVSAEGLASYTEPGDTKPLLFTVFGNRLIRGSAVSTPVDSKDGTSKVDHAAAAAFNPINGLMYFVLAEPADQTTGSGTQYHLYSINPNAGSSSQILNSLTRSRGSFGNGTIEAIAIDQTGGNSALLYAINNEDGKLGVLNITGGSVANVNTDAINYSATPLSINCQPLLGAGEVTGLAFFGDDPEATLGEDPTRPEQFLYAMQNAGANSQIVRIRLGSGTAMFWGSLPDPDDKVGPITGEDLQDLTFNPGLVDPFTGKLGALLATDVTTDQMMYVDHRLRPSTVNIFHIGVAQADATSEIIIGEWNPNVNDPKMIPYTGSVGQLRVINTQAPPVRILVSGDDGTGSVFVGVKTINTDCSNNNPTDLIPLTTATLTRPFGMIPMGDGVLHAGVSVLPSAVTATNNDFTGKMLGNNLDLVQALSVAKDGTQAAVDGDHEDPGYNSIAGDELSIDGGTPVVITSSATGDPLAGIQALDWADPGNTGTEQLYAVYVINGAATLGTINTTTGVFTAVAALGNNLSGIQAMSFNSAGQLYIVDTASTLYRVDPATGAIVQFIGTVATGTGPVRLKSMDFDAADHLIGQDQANGRLISIDTGSAQAGVFLLTDAGSLRASIGAISYDPAAKGWVAADNALSREQIGPVGTNFPEGNLAESAMIVTLTAIDGSTANTTRVQDIGKLMVGGAVTGRVNVSGSVDLFYAGWLLTGASGGQFLVAPTDPANFKVGGELRNLVTIDSIGTNDATNLDTTQYLTGFDMAVGGKVGQIATRDHFVGSLDIANLPNAPALPDTVLQQELETKAPNIDTQLVFGSGILAGTYINNDSFTTPQFVGVINDPTLNTGLHPNAGTNVISLNGTLVSTPPVQDFLDFYAVSLMAGQTIQIQAIPTGLLDTFNVGLIDPDGRVIATDYSDVDAGQYFHQWFQVTAKIPGLYRIVIGVRGDGAFTGTGVQPTAMPMPYQLIVESVGNVALGAAAATQNFFDGRASGTAVHIGNGDLGALYAGNNLASMSTPAAADETFAGVPQDALTGATVDVSSGNLRTLDAAVMGRADLSLGTTFDVFNGGVGLIQTRTGVMNVNSNFGLLAPRVSDHEDPTLALSRNVAVRDDIQLVSSAGTFFGSLLSNKAIGVVRAGDFATTSPSMVIANADQQGSDGIIDLIDSEGDFGTVAGGGPAIETGPGGNLRYLFVRGDTYRDTFFGSGLPPAPEETDFEPGEAATIFDDSGAEVKISPVPSTKLPRGATPPSLHIVTYGVRGSGGSAIVSIRSDDGISIQGRSDDPAASAEIGGIILNGTGTAPTVLPNGRLQLPGKNASLLKFDISGSAPVDVFLVQGGDIYSVSNNSKGVDADSGFTRLGELVNVVANTIGILSAGTIGVPSQATASEVAGLPILATGYPFTNQRTGVLAGNIYMARASGAMGNIVSLGTISQIVADADHKRDTGAFEGIVGPIYAAGQMPDVSVGAGIAYGGNGNMARAGLFALGAIGQVRGDDAHIFGPIVSTDHIDRINLTGLSSIRGADILAVADLSMAREFATKRTTGGTGTINNPTYQIGNIVIAGDKAKKNQPAPANGGIIGTYIAGANIGTTKLTNSFGIIDSVFGIIANGRMKDFLTDGYGIRDTQIIAGASVGRMILTGDGANLPVTNYSAQERYSETEEWDPITGFAPNRTTDLHVYMSTTKDAPTNDGTTNSGVFAGTTVQASRDLSQLSAWRVQPGIDDMGPAPSDFHIANSIGSFTTRQDAENVQITTGKLGTMTIGRDLLGPSITVAGIFSKLSVTRDFVPDNIPSDLDIIRATGSNGQILNIFIGRNMRGTISAFKKIGKVTVRGAFTGAVFQHGVQILP